jgi:MFS family permease
MTLYQRQKVKKSLKLSVLDGSAFAAMLGLTQSYITPFALALGATTAQIGLLSSFPGFSTAISQLAAPGLTERAGSRKRFILPMVLVHALMWLPIGLIPFTLHHSQVWWLIVFVTISSIFGAIANPAWGSLMADLVPVNLRGRYFGVRTRIAGIITLVFSFAAGGILQIFSGHTLIGFAIIFSGAAICRFSSIYFLAGMYEPLESKETESSPGLVRMLRDLGSSNLGRFTLYVALINLTTNIASPFFAVYMLNDLKFNYTTYIINVSFYFLAALVVQTYWGRRADWAGNIKVIAVTSLLIPLVPVVWLFSTNVYYLIAAQVFSGFAWGGFNLASVNFVYDSSENKNRAKLIAFFNAAAGVALCLGALMGGYVIPYLPPIFGHQLLTLFLLSGLLRGVIVILMLRLILEVRHVPRVNIIQLFLGHSTSNGKQTYPGHRN